MESRKYRTCGHGCVRPGFVRAQLATHVLRQKRRCDDRRRCIQTLAHLVLAFLERLGRRAGRPLSRTGPSSRALLTRADGASLVRPILFAMAGT